MKAAYALLCMAILLLSDISFGQKGKLPQAGPLRPNLGTASTYAIFTGGGAINNTGLSQLTGDVGQDGAYAFNGFPPGTYTGTLNRNNGASALAKTDLLTAWTTNAAVTCDIVLGVGIVDGQSFDPAVYCSGGASTTTGNITFDAHGDATAIFIVKIGGQLDANSGTHILLANNAQAGNIYWFVDGAVNIADNSTFKGTIFARGAITFLGTSSLDGRALVAPAGAINIAANIMSVPGSGTVSDITVTRPAQGDSVISGTQNYQITWTGNGIGSTKTIQYSLDSGLTWITIGTASGNVFTYNWNIPDTVSQKARVRVTDENNLRGISGIFRIVQGLSPGSLIVVRPELSEIVVGGTQNYQITWSGTGLTLQKMFELSLDGGLTWTSIGTTSTDGFTFSWNVPDTATILAVVRITDQNGATGTSGTFRIKSSKPNPGNITVVHPELGEIIVGGTQNYQITWTGTGIAALKTFDLSIDGGLTWATLGTTSTDGFTYGWNVPDIATTQAVIRIIDQNGTTGLSGLFTITLSNPNPGSIVVTHPIASEVLEGGAQNFLITFTSVNVTPQKTLEYSLDGGASWSLIGFMNSDAQSFNWANVPNVATTQALVRITDANGVIGTSGLFTITSTPGVGSINSLTLTGLDNKNNIKNNNTLGISWTYTPEIGTVVSVEYSLDYTSTWTSIATVPVSESSNTSWSTPMTGYYNPVFIRVTSSLGMTRTSTPFSIGTNASVLQASMNGYSVSTFPNPAGSHTTINIILPVASDVSMTFTDALGRVVGTILAQHMNAGTHTMPFDVSKFETGIYTYILEAGSTRLAGKMNIIN